MALQLAAIWTFKSPEERSHHSLPFSSASSHYSFLSITTFQGNLSDFCDSKSKEMSNSVFLVVNIVITHCFCYGVLKYLFVCVLVLWPVGYRHIRECIGLLGFWVFLSKQAEKSLLVVSLLNLPNTLCLISVGKVKRTSIVLWLGGGSLVKAPVVWCLWAQCMLRVLVRR